MTTTEEMLVEPIPSEEEDKETGVGFYEPFYKIISYPADYTLRGLYDKWASSELIIPEFQRGWVWSHAQASKLIDSFLLGLPVPSIFLYKDPFRKQIVIDGHQRLRTVCSFFDGKLPDGKNFYLKDVSPPWEGKCYSNLDESVRRHLRDSVLRAVIVEQLDPKDDTSIYHIFERLNTGGTGLTPQEVRNCVYHGSFNDLMIRLNQNITWRSIFGTDNPDTRMRDIELIVRFLALWKDSDRYAKPMKGFLNSFMAEHQCESATELYETIFIDTVEQVAQNLGSRPFHPTRGINAAIFDSVMVAFARASSVPADIKDRFRILRDNPSYQDAISDHTTDVDKVKTRISSAQEVLFG